MGRRCHCGPDRAADREDELSERAQAPAIKVGELFFAELLALSDDRTEASVHS